eukprot:1346499-Amorphochlora_amoeboformis.AAC.2
MCRRRYRKYTTSATTVTLRVDTPVAVADPYLDPRLRRPVSPRRAFDSEYGGCFGNQSPAAKNFPPFLPGSTRATRRVDRLAAGSIGRGCTQKESSGKGIPPVMSVPGTGRQNSASRPKLAVNLDTKAENFCKWSDGYPCFVFHKGVASHSPPMVRHQEEIKVC